jgi:hypothetical protein
MPSIDALCFRVAELYDQPGDPYRAEIKESSGRTALWFSGDDQVWVTDLPADGAPGFGKCVICKAWCWVPPEVTGSGIVCLAHDEAEWDAHELA